MKNRGFTEIVHACVCVCVCVYMHACVLGSVMRTVGFSGVGAKD